MINTASGALLDLADPDPGAICVEDIAAALSKICRFGAQTSQFYSVAQHAVLVEQLVSESGRVELSLAALHHDSHEAFAGDITTPLKQMLGSSYEAVCTRLDAAIGQALGIVWPEPGSEDAVAIKSADRQALQIEGAALLPTWRPESELLGPLPPLASPLSPRQAELRFLDVHHSPKTGPA